MLHINDLVYRIGGRPILEGASASIPAGHKVGLIGRNGAGKSTLLRLIAGELTPDAGEISLSNRASLAMVSQEAPSGATALIDYVLESDEERTRLLARAEISEDSQELGEIHARLEDIEAHSAPARAARILAGLGFDEAAQQRPLSEFSGGWRMRVALAATLFLEPDLLLLDEPTNYLDLEGTLWLETYLARYPHTVLLVSHDRDLLNGAVNAILHLDRGGLRLYRGGYDDFERLRREQQLQQERLRERQDAQRKHMQAFVDRFRYKASKARQAQSRLKALERMEPIAAVAEDPNVAFRFPEPEELRPPLIAAEKAAVGYVAETPVLRGLDFRIDAEDRIALLGRNGNGKTTLARLLAGRLPAMAGEIRFHTKLRVALFAQHQIEELNPDEDAVQHLARVMPGRTEAQLRAHLGGFGLTQDKATVTAEGLSGGERARLVLAMISAEAPNLLILDEPTNHLDIDAREALVRALNDFGGAVVLISHDRHLIELAADRLWLVDGGTVTPFDGDMDEYRRFVLRGRRETPNTPVTSGDRTEVIDEAAGNRRDARRAAAERRAQLAPLAKAIKDAEKEMARLERDAATLEARLADPDLYRRDPAEATRLNKQHADLKSALAAAETRWLAASEELEAAQAAADC